MVFFTSTDTRIASNLSPEQLARKRANDRESQRQIRIRTKQHIARLEEEVHHFRNTDTHQAIQRLEHRNAFLEEQLRQMVSGVDNRAANQTQYISGPSLPNDPGHGLFQPVTTGSYFGYREELAPRPVSSSGLPPLLGNQGELGPGNTQKSEQFSNPSLTYLDIPRGDTWAPPMTRALSADRSSVSSIGATPASYVTASRNMEDIQRTLRPAAPDVADLRAFHSMNQGMLHLQRDHGSPWAPGRRADHGYIGPRPTLHQHPVQSIEEPYEPEPHQNLAGSTFHGLR